MLVPKSKLFLFLAQYLGGFSLECILNNPFLFISLSVIYISVPSKIQYGSDSRFSLQKVTMRSWKTAPQSHCLMVENFLVHQALRVISLILALWQNRHCPNPACCVCSSFVFKRIKPRIFLAVFDKIQHGATQRSV